MEMTPKYSLILWWPPKNIHKIFIPKKYYFFLKTRKKLNFKILNPQKLPVPTYVWKYQSTIPPPPGDSLQKYDMT